jgi:hypothetical protein
MQSVSQFPFRNAILKLRVRNYNSREAYLAVRSSFFEPMKKPAAIPPSDLAALRKNITELVAQNAIPMVQQAIDAVREDGQYQAIKHLFEMIGLYPATSEGESPVHESLARTLLDHLGLDAAVSADQMDENESKAALP